MTNALPVRTRRSLTWARRASVLIALAFSACASPPGTTIVGHVSSHDGEPVADAPVALLSLDAPADTLAVTATDPDGRFSLATDMTGVWALDVGGDGAPGHRLFLISDGTAQMEASVRLPDTASGDAPRATVTFADPASPAARATSAVNRTERFNNESDRAVSAVIRRATEASEDGAPHITSAVRAEMDSAVAVLRPDAITESLAVGVRTAETTLIRQAYLVSYVNLQTAGKDSSLARHALDSIPPASPLWAVRPGAAYAAAVQARDPAALALARRVMDEHPSPEVGLAIATNWLHAAQFEGDERAVAELYAVIQDRFGDTEPARRLRAELDPGRAVRVGESVPPFSVASLHDPGVRISDASLRGTTYLLDFWATWCLPCVTALPDLTETYESFADRGFEIVSLSFDGVPEDVAAFRESRFPMPWRHAFVEGGFDSEIAQRFEVVGLPTLVLVGPDGTILATEDDLRRDGLRAALAARGASTDIPSSDGSSTVYR